MRRRCGTRLSRGLLALTVAVSGLWLSIAAPPAAYAVEPIALASITLTSVKPALPRRDGTITLAGRVTNISNAPLFRLQAVFWRNQAPITDREGLDQAVGSASNDPIGRRHVTSFQDLFLPTDPHLAPGRSATFTLTAKITDLQLSPTDGVYLMGVHVLQNGDLTAIGRTRILVPVLTTTPKATLRMTSVIALSSRPSLVRPGVLSDDHLAAEIGPRGRLTALLRAAEAGRMSYAIDPAMIAELQTMRSGYQVLNGDGGAGQSAAARWLTGFAALRNDQDGFRLLYGSPDIAALVHGKQRGALAAAAAAGTTVEATRPLPLLILPADGAADQATVDAAEDLDPAAVLLADSSARTGYPLLAGPGVAPIVSYGSTAFGGGPGPDPRETPVHLQQRLLADTWVQASTAAPGSTLGRVRLITSAAQATGDGAGVAAPWIRRSTLSELIRSRPTTWDQNFRYPPAARAAELTARQISALRRFSLSQRTYADLLADAAGVESEANTAVARAASAGWRGQDGARAAWLSPQQAELDDIVTNQVEIRSTRRVSTVAQQGVVFPITIRNLLPRSDTDPGRNTVKVRVEFISDNPQRLSIRPIRLTEILAADNVAGVAEVVAKANGTVPVTAQLLTESGLEVGRPVTIDVKVTQNGTTGWAIAVAAGAAFFGFTFLRVRQVARERSLAAETSASSGPVDALTSAPPADAGAGRAADSRDRFDA